MIEVGSEKQLFADDYLIEACDGFIRQVNQPRKHSANPLLTPTEPWEGNSVVLYGSVIYDEQDACFKMWYQTFNNMWDPPWSTLVCYAISPDGINWEKPSLGVWDYKGSKKNNITMMMPQGTRLETPSVIKDEKDPDPARRYKMTFYDRHTDGLPMGTFAAYSPDGIHWSLREKPIILAGDRNCTIWDSHTEQFMHTGRRPGSRWRDVGIAMSKDFENWEGSGWPEAPLQLIIMADPRIDPPGTQLYGMVPFWYESVYLGFLEMLYIPKRKLDAQLVCSRTLCGRRLVNWVEYGRPEESDWQRVGGGDVFLPRGELGEFDWAWAFPANSPPIIRGNEIWIYYHGRDTLHYSKAPYGSEGRIGLATLRLDGFVSMDAGRQLSWLTLKSIVFKGKRLSLNLETVGKGWLDVELLDEAGKPIPGFEQDKFDRFQGDSCEHICGWQGGDDLSSLAGRPIVIKFHGEYVKLFSFWFS